MPSISCIKKEEVPVLRYIIINADDFGRHAEINRAVEEGLVHGCLRSATVMPGGAAFAGAIDIARRHEELGLGVHFTLVDGHPILPPEEIPSLVGAEGDFLPDHTALLKRYLKGSINLEEVRRELAAQLQKVEATGIPISHVDSHQHMHTLPGIIDIVLDLAARAGIRAVRTPGSYALRSDNTAKNGYYAMLALHDKQQFYGLAPGVSESALQYGVGLGAEARQPGSDGDLTENAASLRFASYGILPLGKNWQLAPSVIAQHSEDRYRDGDRYDWATFNLRVSQGISAHFALLYEASWQYMDLNPNGRSYRYNDNVYQYQAVRGDFYKLTFAPTFKVGDVLDIKARPEIRFFATWMNWDKDLDRYAINDDFGSKGFTAGGTWNFGVQTEIWF